MKTKTLVLTALLSIAGAAATMAQSVYSLNAVGYVNVTIPAGFSIRANPLVASTNKLSTLFTAPPANTVVYKYANGNYQIASYAEDDFGNLGWDNDLTLLPGEGFWIKNNSGAAFTNTFVGEVMQGSLTNAVPSGFSLKGSQVPQSGGLQTVLGYVPSANDVVYLYRNGNYTICSYAEDDFGNLVWDNEPNPNVAEGFWIKTTVAKNWTRNFSTSN